MFHLSLASVPFQKLPIVIKVHDPLKSRCCISTPLVERLQMLTCIFQYEKEKCYRTKLKSTLLMILMYSYQRLSGFWHNGNDKANRCLTQRAPDGWGSARF